MMGVSRAAYYKWTHRKVTVHEQENQAIRDYIIELEEKNHYVFGVKRLMTYINAGDAIPRESRPSSPNHAVGRYPRLHSCGKA